MKPATQGSSVGLSKVERAEDLLPAWRNASMLDPVVIAAQIVTALQPIVSRFTDPMDTAVVSTTGWISVRLPSRWCGSGSCERSNSAGVLIAPPAAT